MPQRTGNYRQDVDNWEARDRARKEAERKAEEEQKAQEEQRQQSLNQRQRDRADKVERAFVESGVTPRVYNSGVEPAEPLDSVVEKRLEEKRREAEQLKKNQSATEIKRMKFELGDKAYDDVRRKSREDIDQEIAERRAAVVDSLAMKDDYWAEKAYEIADNEEELVNRAWDLPETAEFKAAKERAGRFDEYQARESAVRERERDALFGTKKEADFSKVDDEQLGAMYSTLDGSLAEKKAQLEQFKQKRAARDEQFSAMEQGILARNNAELRKGVTMGQVVNKYGFSWHPDVLEDYEDLKAEKLADSLRSVDQTVEARRTEELLNEDEARAEKLRFELDLRRNQQIEQKKLEAEKQAPGIGAKSVELDVAKSELAQAQEVGDQETVDRLKNQVDAIEGSIDERSQGVASDDQRNAEAVSGIVDVFSGNMSNEALKRMAGTTGERGNWQALKDKVAGATGNVFGGNLAPSKVGSAEDILSGKAKGEENDLIRMMVDNQFAGNATDEEKLRATKDALGILAFNEPDKDPAHVLSNGAVIVNPKLTMDRKKFEDALSGADTTPEAKEVARQNRLANLVASAGQWLPELKGDESFQTFVKDWGFDPDGKSTAREDAYLDGDAAMKEQFPTWEEFNAWNEQERAKGWVDVYDQWRAAGFEKSFSSKVFDTIGGAALRAMGGVITSAGTVGSVVSGDPLGNNAVKNLGVGFSGEGSDATQRRAAGGGDGWAWELTDVALDVLIDIATARGGGKALAKSPAVIARNAGFGTMIGSAFSRSYSATLASEQDALIAQGMSKEEAQREATKRGLVAGATTAFVTAAFGRTGVEKFGDKVTGAGIRDAVKAIGLRKLFTSKAGLKTLAKLMGKNVVADGIPEGLEEFSDEFLNSQFGVILDNPQSSDEALEGAMHAFVLGALMGSGADAVHQLASKSTMGKREFDLSNTSNQRSKAVREVDPKAVVAEINESPDADRLNALSEVAYGEAFTSPEVVKELENAGLIERDANGQASVSAEGARYMGQNGTELGKVGRRSAGMGDEITEEDIIDAQNDIDDYQPAEDESPEQAEVNKRAGNAVVKILTGRANETSTEELEALGLTRQDGKFKVQDSDGTPDGSARVTIENGSPVFTDGFIKRLRVKMPAVAALARMNETEARTQLSSAPDGAPSTKPDGSGSVATDSKQEKTPTASNSGVEDTNNASTNQDSTVPQVFTGTGTGGTSVSVEAMDATEAAQKLTDALPETEGLVPESIAVMSEGGNADAPTTQSVATPDQVSESITSAIADVEARLPVLKGVIETGNFGADDFNAQSDGKKIKVNVEAMAQEAADAGFTPEQTAEWIASVIDEEVIHHANFEAARRLHKKIAPDQDFETWRDAHYGKIWQDDFVATGKDKDVIALYTGMESLPDSYKAMEGIRILAQLKASGKATENVRLFQNLGESIISHIREVLDVLKEWAKKGNFSEALQSEIKGMEAILAEYAQANPTVDLKNIDDDMGEIDMTPTPKAEPAPPTKNQITKRTATIVKEINRINRDMSFEVRPAATLKNVVQVTDAGLRINPVLFAESSLKSGMDEVAALKQLGSWVDSAAKKISGKSAGALDDAPQAGDTPANVGVLASRGVQSADDLAKAMSGTIDAFSDRNAPTEEEMAEIQQELEDEFRNEVVERYKKSTNRRRPTPDERSDYDATAAESAFEAKTAKGRDTQTQKEPQSAVLTNLPTKEVRVTDEKGPKSSNQKNEDSSNDLNMIPTSPVSIDELREMASKNDDLKPILDEADKINDVLKVSSIDLSKRSEARYFSTSKGTIRIANHDTNSVAGVSPTPRIVDLKDGSYPALNIIRMPLDADVIRRWSNGEDVSFKGEGVPRPSFPKLSDIVESAIKTEKGQSIIKALAAMVGKQTKKNQRVKLWDIVASEVGIDRRGVDYGIKPLVEILEAKGEPAPKKKADEKTNWIGADSVLVSDVEQYGAPKLSDADKSKLQSIPEGETLLHRIKRPDGSIFDVMYANTGFGIGSESVKLSDFEDAGEAKAATYSKIIKRLADADLRRKTNKESLEDEQARNKAIAKKNGYRVGSDLGDMIFGRKRGRRGVITADNGDGTYAVEVTMGKNRMKSERMPADRIEEAVNKARPDKATAGEQENSLFSPQQTTTPAPDQKAEDVKDKVSNDTKAEDQLTPEEGDEAYIKGGDARITRRIEKIFPTPDGDMALLQGLQDPFPIQQVIVDPGSDYRKRKQNNPKQASQPVSPVLIRQLGDIAVKNNDPLDQAYIDAVGGKIPEGYTKQGDFYVYTKVKASQEKPITEKSPEELRSRKELDEALKVLKEENSKNPNAERTKNIAEAEKLRAMADKVKKDNAAYQNKIKEIEAIPESVESTPSAEPESAPIAKITDKDSLYSFFDRLSKLEVTASDIKTAWEQYKGVESSILEEVKKMTMKQLARFQGMRRPDNKADAVRQTMDTFESQFQSGMALSYDVFSGDPKKSRRAAMDASVAKWTDEMIAESRKEREEKKAAKEKALTNPETASEWEKFVYKKGVSDVDAETRAKFDAIKNGYTLEAAIMKRGESRLTPTELAAYDDVRGLDRKAEEARRAESKAQVRGVEVSTDSEIIETKHTKTGEDLFVVKFAERVERDVYKDMLAAAKKLGGWYSSYRAGGAVPGFQFKKRTDAEQFQAVTKGETVDRSESLQERKGEKQSAAADRLREMADKMEENGEKALNADRKTNTVKRAREAGYAEDTARGLIALAKTMRNLADAMASGDAVHLDGVRTRTHIETLNSLAQQAKREEERSRDLSYSQTENLKGEKPTMEQMAFAKYPGVYLDRSTLLDMIETGRKTPGAKLLANKVAKTRMNRNEGQAVELTDSDKLALIEELAKKTKNWDTIKWKFDTWKRAQAMGIKDDVSLRAALREFVQFKESKAKADPIKALERDLVGRKIDGFFPTPDAVIDQMLEAAGDLTGKRVLEPSAGKGDIVDAVKGAGAEVDAIEVVGTLREILEAKGANLVGRDFMEETPRAEYDAVMMNPPFEKGQDMEHVMHAYKFLKPGGTLVAITSPGPFFRNDAKATEFREWADEVGAEVVDLPEGSFKSAFRPTGVSTKLVTIQKPVESNEGEFALYASKLPSAPITPAQDAAYMKAVESGDMETAQKMVDDAGGFLSSSEIKQNLTSARGYIQKAENSALEDNNVSYFKDDAIEDQNAPDEWKVYTWDALERPLNLEAGNTLNDLILAGVTFVYEKKDSDGSWRYSVTQRGGEYINQRANIADVEDSEFLPYGETYDAPTISIPRHIIGFKSSEKLGWKQAAIESQKLANSIRVQVAEAQEDVKAQGVSLAKTLNEKKTGKDAAEKVYSLRSGREKGDAETFSKLGQKYGVTWKKNKEGELSQKVKDFADKYPSASWDFIFYSMSLGRDPLTISEAAMQRLSDPELKKSAYPVIYDDDGNVIPLSERFNPESDSILYASSLPSVDEKFEEMSDAGKQSIAKADAAQRQFKKYRRARAKWRENKVDTSVKEQFIKHRDMLKDQYEGEVMARYGELLENDEVTKLRSQPIHEFIADPNNPLKGRLMSVTEAKRQGRYGKIHGQYEGAEGVSRTMFGGTMTPQDMAKELFRENVGGLTEDSTEAMWYAMAREQESVTNRKEELQNAREAMREARERANRETIEKFGEKARQPKKPSVWRMRENALSIVGQINAIRSLLPGEIRDRLKVPANLERMSDIEEIDNAMRLLVARADGMLEDHLRTTLKESIDEIVVNSDPKDPLTRRVKGKISAEGHDFFSMAQEAMNLTQDEVEGRRTAIMTKINEAETKEDAMTHSEKLAALELFGGAEDATSERLEFMLDELQRVYKEGRARWRMIQDFRLSGYNKEIDENADNNKVPRVPQGSDINKDESDAAQKTKSFYFNKLSFAQLMDRIGGVGEKLTRKIRNAQDAYQDKHTATRKEFVAEMKKILGTTNGLTVDKALHKFSKRVKNSPVEIIENASVKPEKIEPDRARKLLNGEVNPSSLGLNTDDMIAIDAALRKHEQRPEGERNRVTYLHFEKSRGGRRVNQSLSQLEALNWLLLWNQPDLQENLRRVGFDDITAQQLERFISPEVHAIGKWMVARGQNQFGELNAKHRRVYGVSIPGVSNYFPAWFEHNSNGETAMEFDETAMQQNGISAGFLKTRIPHGVMPQRANALSVFWGHQAQMDYWLTHVEPLLEVRYILGGKRGSNVLRAANGNTYTTAVQNFVKRLENNGKNAAIAHHAESRWIRNMQSAFALSVLGLRVSTLAIQSTAMLGSAGQIGSTAYLKSLVKTLRDPSIFKKIWNSPMLRRRLEEGFSYEARLAMESMNINPTMLGRLAQKGMVPINTVDAAFSTISLGVAYQYWSDQAAKKGVHPSKRESWVMDKVNDTQIRTAQPNRTDTRSLTEMEIADSPVLGLFAMFVSEPRQKLALQLTAMEDIFRKDGKGKAKAADRMLSLVAISIMAQVVRELLDGRDDDDDVLSDPKALAYQAFAGHLRGAPVFGDIVNAGFAMALDQRFFKNSLPVADIFEDTGRSLGKFNEAYTKDDARGMLGAGMDVLQAIGIGHRNLAIFAQVANLGEGVNRLVPTAGASSSLLPAHASPANREIVERFGQSSRAISTSFTRDGKEYEMNRAQYAKLVDATQRKLNGILLKDKPRSEDDFKKAYAKAKREAIDYVHDKPAWLKLAE